MPIYTLDELIDRWNRGQFAEVQVITHMLLLLREQERRLAAVERDGGQGDKETRRQGDKEMG